MTGQTQVEKCAWVVPFVENHFHPQEKKEDVEMKKEDVEMKKEDVEMKKEDDKSKKESSAIFHQPPERLLIKRFLLFLQIFYPSRYTI